MLRPLCLYLALFSLLLAPFPATCQNTDFVAALSGDKHPLTMKLKDLDSSWRHFTPGNSGDAGNGVQIYLSMLTAGTQNTYYTQGKTETLGGEIYLVSYHQPTVLGYAAVMRAGADGVPPPTQTPETTLCLSLLNIRLIGCLNDISPFSLADALKPAASVAEADSAQASVSNLKQIGLALVQYIQDYDEVLPPMKSVSVVNTAIYPYLKIKNVLEQPSTHELYQVNTSLSKRSFASFADPATMVTYYEARPDKDGLRAVLFLDGHVKRVTDGEWQKLRVASHVPNPAGAVPK